MLLWKSNLDLNIDADALAEKVCVDDYFNSDGFHTTFYKPPEESRADYYLLDTYKDVIEKMTKDLGLYHRTQYQYQFWTQVYPGDNITHHVAHDHFSGNEILSWVHFIKPAEKDCFCFLDSDGNPTFPKEQRKNDFIVFPSWALHKILPFRSDEKRIVVAGNVALKTIAQEYAQSYMTHTCTVLKNCMVWEDERLDKK